MRAPGALKHVALSYADKYVKNPDMKYDFMNGYNQSAKENYIIFSLAAVYEKLITGEITRTKALEFQKQIFYASAIANIEDKDYD